MFRTRDYVLYTPGEISGIRIAAQATAQVRDELASMITPGMTTAEVDELAGRLIAATGGTSSFLNYNGFPAQICISVNDVVIHGIASPAQVLQTGDLVSLDLGVTINGCTGDSAVSFIVGRAPDPDEARLLETTREALMAGIEAAVAGNHIRDISRAVERCAVAGHLGIVREFVGHGCGSRLHEPPDIPNYNCGRPGPRLQPGMVLAIEPMFTLGSPKVRVAADGWTVHTCDGKKSAHFEHMVLITDKQPEILTWRKTM